MNDASLTIVRKDATRVLASVVDAAPEAEVPACPGWTVERVAIHVGRIQRWITDALVAPAGTDVPPAPSPTTDVGAWLVSGADELSTALTDAGPDGGTTAPGWVHPASFWRRRTAHEVVIHAGDVLVATGREGDWSPPTEAAIDGVDEFLEVFVPVADWGVVFPEGATIHLHSTDGDSDGEWLVRLGPDGVTVTREHAKGDVAVRGPAEALLRWLWGRDDAAVELLGDTATSSRFVATPSR